MGKLTAGLTVFSILAALVLGLAASTLYVQSGPAVVAAIAEQEHARAEQLAAEADSARAHAAGAWGWVSTTRALAAVVADWAPAFLLVAFLAFAIMALGLSLSVVGWARSRAALRVVAGPAGPVLAYAHG